VQRTEQDPHTAQESFSNRGGCQIKRSKVIRTKKLNGREVQIKTIGGVRGEEEFIMPSPLKQTPAKPA